MKTPYNINNRVFSPYLVFIKCARIYENHDLLKLLGLNNHNAIEAEDDVASYFYIARCDEWVHVIDDWFYTLWYSKNFRRNIGNLAKSYDVFTCSIGESDDSFDFEYYKNGELVRKFVVEDPDDAEKIITENYGAPLYCEAAALSQDDNMDKVLYIAKSLGINVNYDELQPLKYGIREDHSLFNQIKRRLL